MLKKFRVGRFYVLETSDFTDKLLETVGDEEALKKILVYIGRLADRIPSRREMWRHLGGDIYELKPKPYRVACYKKGTYVVVFDVWRKSGKKGKDKRYINKALSREEEIAHELEEFIKSQKP